MQKFIETLKNIWAIDELKNRILITLFFLAIYRLGAQVVLPGVDYNIIADAKIAGDGGLLGLLNAFTGGAFANASVFALGIMPYISASQSADQAWCLLLIFFIQLMPSITPAVRIDGDDAVDPIFDVTFTQKGQGIALFDVRADLDCVKAVKPTGRG